MNFFSDLWSDYLVDSTLLYWALIPIALIVAGVTWLVRKAPTGARVGAVAVVAVAGIAAIAGTVVLTNDESATADPDDLYRTPDGLVERQEYDPLELWDGMTLAERNQACASFQQGRTATLNMLSEAGYPAADSRAVVDLLDEKCEPRPPVTTTTTAAPTRPARATPPGSWPYYGARYDDAAVTRAAGWWNRIGPLVQRTECSGWAGTTDQGYFSGWEMVLGSQGQQMTPDATAFVWAVIDFLYVQCEP